MDLLSQLKSASAYAKKGGWSAPSGPHKYPRTAAQIAQQEKTHKAHTDKSVERYKSVMESKGWMSTFEIETALGYGRTVARGFLKRLEEDLKIIEKRPRGGAVYNKKKGWEFRWITKP